MVVILLKLRQSGCTRRHRRKYIGLWATRRLSLSTGPEMLHDGWTRGIVRPADKFLPTPGENSMAIKIAVCAIGASVALLGCQHDPRSMSSQRCDNSPCQVPVGQTTGCTPFNEIIVANEIQVFAGRPMTITWTLDSSVPSATHFNPVEPIKFEPQAERFFRCAPAAPPTEPRSVSCVNDASKGTYKYTIRTKGWCSPLDLDPTVVNN